MNSSIAVIILTMLAFMPCLQSIKVGILPMIGSSHTLTMDLITQTLLKRGHETVTIISNEPRYLKKLKPSPLALYQVENPTTSEDLQKLLGENLPLYKLMAHFFEYQRTYCDATVSNKTLMKSIQDVDIIVSDALYVCSILVPELLNKSYVLVSFSGGINGIFTFGKAYEPTTYIPIAGSMITSKMSFLQRAGNVIAGSLIGHFVNYFTSNVTNILRFKHNIGTHLTLYQLRRKFSVFLSTLDFSIEYSRPLPPYIHVVGPVTPKPTSPLPQTLEEIMQSSKNHGVILVSFGSELQLSDEKLPEMVKALGQLPYTIIWKTKQKLDNIPSNINIIEWMPQNDILGHNKTIAFINHCGSNGLYEAAYHGVPMVGMPSMIEQKANAARIAHAGIAIIVNFFTFEAVDIVNAVSELVGNTRYKDNAIKVKKILRSSSRSPTDAITDWIEFVVRTDGAHHLKVEGDNLYFYQFYNLDVMLLVIFIAYILYRLIGSCLNIVSCSKSKSKVD